jgi:hypothetical protein
MMPKRDEEKGSKKMFHKMTFNVSASLSKRYSQPSIIVALLAIVVVFAASVLPAFAAAPATGTVVEGVGVPGVNLVDTRADVEAAYGPPDSCKDLSYYDGRRGIDGICDFAVDGGGQVTLYYYRDVDRNPAQGSPDDIALAVRWPEAVNGWTTTAGVNTTLAEEDPEAVVAAYPDAVVTRNQFWAVLHVQDYEQGIEISWFYNFYNPKIVTISMIIRPPSDPPPPREPSTRVTDIDLTTIKRQVAASVRVNNDLGWNVPGANVTATWTFPEGHTELVTGITDGFGLVRFTIDKARRGTYTFTIEDVILDGHPFDRDNSVLSASITKPK